MLRRRPLAFALFGLGMCLAGAPAAAQSGSGTQPGTAVSKDRPANRGSNRTIVCRGAAIPSGWILVNDMRDPGSCGGDVPATLNAYNVWSIEKYDGRPVGTVIDVCAAAQTPPGWVIVDVYRDRDLCGHPDGLFTANVKRIRRAS